MHKSVMRQLLPLAVVCLLAAQLAAGTRIGVGRSLLRAVKPNPQPVNLTRNLFVQATWALEGVSCDDVAEQVGTPYVNNSLAIAATKDTLAQAQKLGQSSAVVVAQRQPCVTFEIGGKTYASYRTMVRINTTTTTAVRDDMWWGVYAGSTNGCKTGGYDKTLWANVAKLFEGFTVSQNNGNRNNSFGGSPGGPGPTGTGMNWIEYAAPNMTICQPKPSPVPSPSPSPEVPSPSPSPSPSPTPSPCPSNSTLVNGTCTCDAGLLASFNGTTLVSCTAGTTCPPSAPVAVKINAPATLYCITTDTPCPAGNTLAFYSGSPSVRIECRPTVSGCNVAPFSLQVQNAAGVLIGCANATSDDCPFVSFRGAGPTYTLIRCQDVSACPSLSLANSDFTVPLLAANAPLSSVPKACITVGASSSQACPAVSTNPLLNYPIEVMFSQPTSPVCGGSTPCGSNTLVACYAPGTSSCPSNYALSVFSNGGVAAAVPQLVECRALRTVCDLSQAGMGNTNPNAASYTLTAFNGVAVEGCISTNAAICPASYPVAQFNGNGGIASCGKNGTTPSGCPGGSIPKYNVNNTVTGCQPQTSVCPSDFPITLIENFSGLRAGCVAQGIASCPPGYSFPTYGKFTGSNALTITSCFKDGAVGACTSVNFAPGVLAPGADGPYTTPIISNVTGTQVTKGCVQTSANACPSSASFSFITFNDNGAGTITSSVSQCVVSSEAPSSCPASFPKPGFTQSTLTACISYVLTNGPPPTFTPGVASPKCPAAYPIAATGKTDPSTISVASDIIACYSASSTCYENSPQALFTRVITQNVPQPVAFCTPGAIGLSNCAGFGPGAQLWKPDGSLLIGCSDATATCPPQFPIFFQDVLANTLVRCQASVTGTCASVSGNVFPVEIRGGSQSLLGCQTAPSQCTAGQVEVAQTATGPVEQCLAAGTTVCTTSGRTFALYSGTGANGFAQLVRCIATPAASNCDGAALGSFNVEVFDATGSLAGCLVQQANTADTKCPASSPQYYLDQGVAVANVVPFTLSQCRAGGACTVPAYNIPLLNVPQAAQGEVTLGCLAAQATSCPGALISNVQSTTPLSVPFFLLGTSASAPVVQCRQIPVINAVPTFPTSTCQAFLGASTQFTSPTQNGADLIGCSLPNGACAAGFFPQFLGTVQQSGCVAACVLPSDLALYNSNGVQVGCGNAATCGAAPYAGGVPVYDSQGNTQTGCTVSGVAACPNLGAATFALYTGGSPTSRPTLSQCWADAGGATDCTNVGNAGARTIEIAATTAAIGPGNPLRGCTPPGVQCPAAAQYFFGADATSGLLVEPGSSCLINPLPASCPVGVPVVNAISPVNTGPVIGCLGTAPSFTNAACPNSVPAPGTYGFEVVTGSAVGAAAAGDVVQCLRSTASCGDNARLNAGGATGVFGCLINVPTPAGCPGVSVAGVGVLDFPSFISSSSTDATAKLDQCTAAPQVCAAPYPVPTTDQAVDQLDNTQGTLLQCVASNTACPTGTAALINSAGVITGCRTGGGTCAASAVALCDLSAATAIPIGGDCTGGTIAACSQVSETTVSSTCYQNSAALPRNYPVAKPFPYFAVQLDAAASPDIQTCYATTASAASITCGGTNPGPPAVGVYSARAFTGTSPGTASGCTDLDVSVCQSWWGNTATRSCIQQP